MTFNELKKQVTYLGFETGIDDSEALAVALGRALELLYTDCPVIKQLRLYQRAARALTVYPEICHSGGERETVSLTGSCYSFLAFGKGSFIIKDGDGERSFDFEGDGILFRGFIDGYAILTVYGDTVHSICRLATFSEHFTDEKSIPLYREPRSYELTDLAPDFSFAKGAPCGRGGIEIGGAEILGSTLFLPPEYSGEVQLLYKAAPPSVSAILPDAPFNIPREQEGLLPLVTASFLWLDDDFDKASYYMSLYKSSLSARERLGNGRQCCRGVSTNGWA